MTTPDTSKNVTWDELLESISTGAAHPDETNWKIFRYLQHNYKTMGSVMARTLLAAYMKLHVKRMSLIDSCMLGMAVNVSETYSDFKLPKFLEAWGYDRFLRPQDLRRQTGKDGRQYLSLKERVERALQSYMLHHPEENKEACDTIVSMYAAKWEICGRMFDVLRRVSKQGNERAADIVLSQKRVDEVFSVEVGYVDFVDENHGHIHVYDSQSRHFVALKSVHSALNITAGSYVRFCPIIANGDHFKWAAIVGLMDKYEGRNAFGVYDAKVEYANPKEKYIRYSLESAIKYTPEGNIIKGGFASTAALPDDVRNGIVIDSHVRLILFLKRGKDGIKHNYVAEVF